MTPPTHNAPAGSHARPRTPALIGYLTRLPPHRAGTQAAGQLLYLPLSGAVVVPYRQVAAGWDTVVVADPSGTHRPGTTWRLADLEIETALTVPMADPLAALPADEYAAVWLTRVWGHSPGGNLWAVARVLAEELRPCGHLTVILDDSARRRLTLAARVIPPGLGQLIDRLTRDGYLTHVGDRTYRFSLGPAIPELPHLPRLRPGGRR
jgi:hypothetical protein